MQPTVPLIQVKPSHANVMEQCDNAPLLVRFSSIKVSATILNSEVKIGVEVFIF